MLSSSLLPLWEGYDEPFHYAYVQHLVDTRQWPVTDKSRVSEEIHRAWELAPTSVVWARTISGLTNYRDYFALPEQERLRRRRALEQLPTALRRIPRGTNYEAQQPPLAYLLLAPLDVALTNVSLPVRILVMRLFCAWVSLGLFLFAFYQLGKRMAIPDPFLHAAIFCFLSLQNVYGSIGHIANDWLALPLIGLLFLAADHARRQPGPRSASILALTLACGLLAKSYFLIFVPVALLLVLWHSRRQTALFLGIVIVAAGPWYWRNWHLYGSVSGLQTEALSVPRAALIQSAGRLDWPSALLGMGRASLWSANSSFMTFSAATLNVFLALLALGCCLWIISTWHRRPEPAGWTVAVGTLLFVAIPVWAMLLHGTRVGQIHTGANPWHGMGVLPGVVLIAFAGCGKIPALGRWIARGLCLLSAYLVLTTFFMKLFPLYAGFADPHGLVALKNLYLHHGAELFARLDQSALAGGGSMGWLAALLFLGSSLLGARIWRQLGTQVEYQPPVPARTLTRRMPEA